MPHRVLRRTLTGIGIFFVTLIVAIAVLLAVVVFTEGGTRFALTRFVSWFDGRVPGQIEHGDITGSLADGVHIERLAIKDSQDHPLIVAEALVVDAGPLALFDLALGIDEISATGLEVHLWPPEVPGFADLSTGDKPPKPPGEPPGPNIPIHLYGPLQVDGFALYRHEPDGRGRIGMVENTWLRARLDVHGRVADVAVDALWGDVPVANLVLAAAQLDLHWDAGVIEVSDTSIVSSAAWVHELDARFDIPEKQGRAELLATALPRGLTKSTAQVIPPFATVEVTAALDGTSVWALLDGDAPGLTKIQAQAIAGLQELSAMASIRVAPDVGADRRGRKLEPLHLFAVLHRSPTATRGHVVGLLPDERVGGWLAANLRTGEAATLIEAQVRGPATIDARAELADGTLARAEARIDIDSLARVGEAAGAWIDLPPLGGRLAAVASCQPSARADLRCTAELDAADLAVAELRVGSVDVRGTVVRDQPNLSFDAAVGVSAIRQGKLSLARVDLRASGSPARIDADLRLSDGPRRELATEARIELGDAIAIRLNELGLRWDRRRLWLASPTTVTIANQRVDIDGLALGGTEHIAVDGYYRWGQAPAADIETEIVIPDLTPLLAYVDRKAQGSVRVRAELEGSMAAPSIELRVDGQNLAFENHRIGQVRLDLDHVPGRSDLSAALQGSIGGAVVDASAPVRLGLQPFAFDLDRRSPIELIVDASVPDLRALPLGKTRLEGIAEAHVRLHGTAVDPVLAVEVTANHVQLNDLALGNSKATVAYADERIDVSASAVTGWMKRLELAARGPLAVKFGAPWIEWGGKGRYELALDVEQVRLEELGDALASAKAAKPIIILTPGAIPIPLPRNEPTDEAMRLGGVTDLHALLAWDAGGLDGHLKTLTRDLVVDGIEIGAIEAEVTVDPGETRLAVQASGPVVRVAEIRGRVPLRISGPGEPFSWTLGKRIEGSVDIREAKLAEITRAVRVGPAGGRLTAQAKIDGTLDDPRIDLSVDARRLSWRTRPVGNARLLAKYDDRGVRAEFEQANRSQSIDVDLRIPVAWNGTTRKIAWKSEAPHHVDLTIKGLDRESLEPFVEMPGQWGFDMSAKLQARGSALDPEVRGELRGSFSYEKRVPTNLHALITANGREQRAEIAMGAHGPRTLTVEAVTRADVAKIIRDGFDARAVTIDARLSAKDFDLADLAPMMPTAIHEPSGELDILATVNGSMAAPRLAGTARLANGRLTVVPLNQQFKDVELRASLEGGTIELQQLKFESGNGTGKASGRMKLARGDTRGSIRIVLDGIPVVKPGLPLMKLDAAVQVDLDATGEVTRLDVGIEDGFVDVLDTKIDRTKRVPSSDRIVYVDARVGEREKKGPPQERPESDTGKEPWMPKAFELDLALTDPVLIRGPKIDMSWSGDVVVLRRPDGTVKAEGVVQTNRGNVALLGNEFDIDYGRVTIPPVGDLDPYIDFAAITQTPEAEVTMIVRGRASRPELILRSDPPLPQSSIFALLITGRTDAGEGEETDFTTAAASLLVAFQNSALQRELQDRVGIDRVGVEFGEEIDQPIVTVGKRLSRKVYVETAYHHNAPADENQAELRVDYTFKPPRWSIETWFGDAAEGGVGLWWERRFNAPKRRNKGYPPPKSPANQRDAEGSEPGGRRQPPGQGSPTPPD